MLRGYNRIFAEISNELKIPSVCISHGTVSKAFNVYGSIYQNIIAEDVFSGKQSRVWQQALNRVHVQKSILLYCFNKLR